MHTEEIETANQGWREPVLVAEPPGKEAKLVPSLAGLAWNALPLASLHLCFLISTLSLSQ